MCLSGIPDSHKDFMGSLPCQGPALLEFYRRPSELAVKVLVNHPRRNSENHRRADFEDDAFDPFGGVKSPEGK